MVSNNFDIFKVLYDEYWTKQQYDEYWAKQLRESKKVATKVTAVATPDDDDNTDKSKNSDLDIPTFDDDIKPETAREKQQIDYAIANDNSTLSLDDLNNVGFNDEQDEIERAKLNAPTGDWFKEDRWQFEKKTNSGDSLPGDIDASGRTTLNVMGRPVPREANGISYEPMLFLRISPDKRYKMDKPTDIDMAYKLFLKAKDLYIEINGEKATNLRQLVTMLEEDGYVVRTMNGDSGPVVVDLKSKKVKR